MAFRAGSACETLIALASEAKATFLRPVASKSKQRPGRPPFVVTLDVINAVRYHSSMIRNFRDTETERLFQRERPKKLPPDIHRTALRKLVQLNAVVLLSDLRVPPGNQLEALHKDREGQHSIRINDQWRICFVWRDGGAENVEIVDYH